MAVEINAKHKSVRLKSVMAKSLITKMPRPDKTFDRYCLVSKPGQHILYFRE